MRGQHSPKYDMQSLIFQLMAKGYESHEIASMSGFAIEQIRAWRGGEKARAKEHKKLLVLADSARNLTAEREEYFRKHPEERQKLDQEIQEGLAKMRAQRAKEREEEEREFARKLEEAGRG